MEEKKKILIVEDERAIVEILKFNLAREGYETLEALDGETGLQLGLTGDPDLILLDVMLPKMNGFDICAKLRDAGSTVPIIMLAAREEETDKVFGLEAGADDYMTKPFSMREVLARVRSVLRRTAEVPAEQETVAFEGLGMDLRRKVCTLDGKELALTKKEFEILALLLAHRGVIFSREEILRRIWSDEVIVLDRTVDVNITRLRRKIGPYGGHIVTRLGYGYGFEE